MWKIAATLEATAKLENNIIKTCRIRNSSPTEVDYTYNGAVALVVIDILKDTKVVDYINH